MGSLFTSNGGHPSIRLLLFEVAKQDMLES